MARCIRGIRGEELSGCVYFGWHVTYPPQLEDTALGGRMQPGAHAAGKVCELSWHGRLTMKKRSLSTHQRAFCRGLVERYACSTSGAFSVFAHSHRLKRLTSDCLAPP